MGLVWKLSEILINQLIRDQQRAAGNRQHRAQLGSVRFSSAARNIPGSAHNERVWVVQVARVGRGRSTGWSTWARVTLIHSTAHNLGKAVVRARRVSLIGLNALSGDYANLRITQILADPRGSSCNPA